MLRTKTPNKAQIPGSKSGSLGLLKRAVTKVLKSTNRRLNKFLEDRVLKGQYHAIFSNTLKIEKTLFG